MLVVTHSSVLNAIQEEFSKLMDTTVEVFQEQISCHQAISESLAELKVRKISVNYVKLSVTAFILLHCHILESFDTLFLWCTCN